MTVACLNGPLADPPTADHGREPALQYNTYVPYCGQRQSYAGAGCTMNNKDATPSWVGRNDNHQYALQALTVRIA